MHRVSQRPQRTLQNIVEVRGHGYLTGAAVRVRFRPAPPDTGVVFVRSDLKNAPPLSARAMNVTGTNRRTTLGRAPAQVEMVEHVLATLYALKIDNCCIELNAPELPGLDGSARDFVKELVEAGLTLQPARRTVWTTDVPITVSEGQATLTFYPASTQHLKVSYHLDYGTHSPLGLQRHTEVVTPEGFLNDLGQCRTFLLEQEAVALRQQGFGRNTSPSDLLVFGKHGPIANRLRFANEPARHKILDIVGDLSLCGHDLAGHVVGHRSGHALNVALVRKLLDAMELPAPLPLAA
jgi:UDP-3-O-acyl N-acetylglucosamine deacetylase